MNQPVPPLESSQRRRPVFYYDGGCGFCRSGVRALSRLDFSHRVAWVSYQSLARPPDGLSWDDLDRAAYLVDGAGVRYEGFFAFRQVDRDKRKNNSYQESYYLGPTGYLGSPSFPD